MLDEKFVKNIIGKLEKVAPIKTRKMFGGLGIYYEDLFFALISTNKLYFKVNDSNRSDYISRNMNPFQPFNEKPSFNYFELPSEVLNNSEELKAWLDKSVSVARNKKKKY